MMKKILFSILCCSIVQFYYAAYPMWTVNPNSFQYQMTLSSKVSIRCNDTNNNNVLVAAFVNGQCRGVDTNKVLLNGYYYTFITIYSNVQIGETVTFKLYDPASDIVYDAIDTQVFENNKNLSNTSYPYLLMSNYRPESITLSRNLVYKTFTKDTKIGDLTTKDKNNSSFTYSIVPNTNNTDDYFKISGNTLLLNKDLIADTIKTLRVLLRTDDMFGCTYDSLFSFTVINNDPPPTGLEPTESSIVEHVPVSTVAKVLKAIDLSPKDEFIYELVSGVGSEGNSKFKIEGDKLLINEDVEYSTAASYPVRIKITDIAKNTVEVPVIITIKEIIYKLNPTDSIIDEHVALGYVAKTLQVQDIAFGGTTYSYELVSGLGSNDNNRYVISGDKLLVNSDIEYDSSMLHSLRVKITNAAGNKIEETFHIKINETINSNQPLKANNLVTPNHDNINEVFEIYNADLYNKFRLTIFDDNGYKTNEYNGSFDPSTRYNNTWNGTSDDGRKLPTGMYYYYFTNSSNQHEYKGSIYLIQPN